MRQRFAAPEEKIIFFIGRLVREKGEQTLLEALPMIRDRIPGVRLIVAGSGPYEEELHRLAVQLGVDRQVTFTGYINEATRNQLYAHAAVAAFPSLYEPFGLVALEAMATGTPVVVGDCGGFAETVADGVNGLRAQPGNAGDLAAKIITLLENRDLAARLSRQGLRDVEERFAWPAIARQYEAVYQKIVFSPEARKWRREATGARAASSPAGAAAREKVWAAASPPSRYH